MFGEVPEVERGFRGFGGSRGLARFGGLGRFGRDKVYSKTCPRGLGRFGEVPGLHEVPDKPLRNPEVREAKPKV